MKQVHRACALALVAVIGVLTTGATICQLDCLSTEHAARAPQTRSASDGQVACHMPGTDGQGAPALRAGEESCAPDTGVPALVATHSDRLTPRGTITHLVRMAAHAVAPIAQVRTLRVHPHPPAGGPARSSRVLRI